MECVGEKRSEGGREGDKATEGEKNRKKGGIEVTDKIKRQGRKVEGKKRR